MIRHIFTFFIFGTKFPQDYFNVQYFYQILPKNFHRTIIREGTIIIFQPKWFTGLLLKSTFIITLRVCAQGTERIPNLLSIFRRPYIDEPKLVMMNYGKNENAGLGMLRIHQYLL